MVISRQRAALCVGELIGGRYELSIYSCDVVLDGNHITPFLCIGKLMAI